MNPKFLYHKDYPDDLITITSNDKSGLYGFMMQDVSIYIPNTDMNNYIEKEKPTQEEYTQL